LAADDDADCWTLLGAENEKSFVSDMNVKNNKYSNQRAR